MAMRQVFRKLLKNISPALSGILFTCCTPSKKLNKKEKLKLELLDVTKLTRETIIQGFALESTEALTFTRTTIINTSAEYRTLLNELISLLTDVLTLNHDVYHTHWDLILIIEEEMEETKEALMKYTGSMLDNARGMAVAISGYGFLHGMDSLSISLCERIDDTLHNVKAEVESNLKLEQAYRQIQDQAIDAIDACV